MEIAKDKGKKKKLQAKIGRKPEIMDNLNC